MNEAVVPFKLRSGEVRVRVAAFAGDPQANDGAPHAAVAGVVVETTAGSMHRAGTRVACIVDADGPARERVVHEQSAFAISDALDDASAAALLCSWPAAWFGLHHRATLRAGESVLVLDASSSIGMACIQLAKAADARVVALTRLRSAFEEVRRAGADDVVSLQEGLWPDIVREHGGADVIAGIAAADVVMHSLRSLARHGRLLLMMPPASFAAELPIRQLLLRGGTVHGAFWSAGHRSRTAGPIVSALLALWSQGRIRP